jgi:tetratricopeptide (TPR) repeat protein
MAAFLPYRALAPAAFALVAALGYEASAAPAANAPYSTATEPSAPPPQPRREFLPVEPPAEALPPLEDRTRDFALPTAHPTANATPQQPAFPAIDRAAMQPVAQRATEISDRAYAMAQRGMYYAARAELIQALQLVAQALDVEQRSTAHAAALAAGLTALKEANDFALQPGQLGAVNVAEISQGHQTPVLKGAEAMSPVVAQQQYFAYAQAQLVLAGGQEPAASLALSRLGQVHMAMGQAEANERGQNGPRAMVYYQAALATDRQNYLAANELGVLMARYGQLHEAKNLLVHSVSIHPHAQGWHNLAVVHRRLGETDLAQRAEHERQLAMQQSPARAVSQPIAWVDAKTFAASGANDPPVGSDPAQTATQPGLRGRAAFGMKR